MPLILNIEEKDKFSVAVWRNEEDLSFFLSKLELYEQEKPEISNLNSNRLLEWYSSRYLLGFLENKRKRSCCLKDKYGKPYLQNSDLYISLSHSYNYVAAVVSKQKIGIDIQKITIKAQKIKNKFLSRKELLFCNEEIDCINMMWTAKEAIYKAYGKKKLSFIDNIKLNSIIEDNGIFSIKASILKNNIKLNYKLYSQYVEDNILTIAIEGKK